MRFAISLERFLTTAQGMSVPQPRLLPQPFPAFAPGGDDVRTDYGGVLAVGETESLNKGTESCGVPRHYSGPADRAGATRYLSPGYGSPPRTENQRMRLKVSSSALSSCSSSSASDFSANSFARPLSFSTGLFISSRGILFFAAA